MKTSGETQTEDKPLLICLMGPTASGKTALAIGLAEARNCELVNADSAQVYRGMDIGTAKSDYPHHLIDIRDPAQPYSAAEFRRDAEAAIRAIHRRGRAPLLVGGSMLYFKALLEGLSAMPAADPGIRARLERIAARRGWPYLHRKLAKADPERAAEIHPNHSQRISRALEVYLATGITMSQWQGQSPGGGIRGEWDVIQLAIAPAERAVLHRRIEERLDQMLAADFLGEVRHLRQRGDLNPELPALRAVGYRQLWAHLNGECDWDEVRRRCLAATRQLAKRQLTWLRGWPELRWIYTDEAGRAAAATPEALQNSPRTPLEVALDYLP